MELPLQPLLSLVEHNANGLKLILKHYIDFTVDNQFDQLKNSILKMIATGQIGPEHCENAFVQSTFPTCQSNIEPENLLILHHSNDQLAITPQQLTLSPCSPLVSTITTSAVIKQECQDIPSITIPINVQCNDALNDEDKEQLNNAEIEVNHAQNGQVPIDDVKEEYDSDDINEDEGEYMSDCPECEDCVKGICQLKQDHLICENDDADDDALNVTDNDHLENNGTSVQSRASQDEFEKEPFDDDGEDQLLSTSQQNNDHSTESTMCHANDQLTTDQITLPPTNQLQTSNKQSNSNLINHNENFEDCLNKEEDEDDETGKHIEVNPDNTESSQLVVIQRSDPTQPSNGQSEVSGQCPIETKQVNGQIQDEPVIQHSIPSTSGLRTSDRKRIPRKLFSDDQSNGQVKSDKRKSTTQSSKAGKKVKHQQVDEIQEEEEEENDDDDDEGNDEVKEVTKLKVVTLELDCIELGCYRVFKSLELWKQHLSSVHGQIAYQHLYDNVRHNQHGQTEYPCTEFKCETVCQSQGSLYQHWRYSHQAGKFECSHCAFVGAFRGEVYVHQESNHRTKLQCTHEGCNKTFKRNNDLAQHKRIHSGKRPFVCVWQNCGQTFKQHSQTIQHVRTQHFRLPKTVKEQNELNIIDERDPKVFVQLMSG